MKAGRGVHHRQGAASDQCQCSSAHPAHARHHVVMWIFPRGPEVGALMWTVIKFDKEKLSYLFVMNGLEELANIVDVPTKTPGIELDFSFSSSLQKECFSCQHMSQSFIKHYTLETNASCWTGVYSLHSQQHD
jgi:hypothetical protein